MFISLCVLFGPVDSSVPNSERFIPLDPFLGGPLIYSHCGEHNAELGTGRVTFGSRLRTQCLHLSPLMTQVLLGCVDLTRILWTGILQMVESELFSFL